MNNDTCKVKGTLKVCDEMCSILLSKEMFGGCNYFSRDEGKTKHMRYSSSTHARSSSLFINTSCNV